MITFLDFVIVSTKIFATNDGLSFIYLFAFMFGEHCSQDIRIDPLNITDNEN